jgi:hypothetical protein
VDPQELLEQFIAENLMGQIASLDQEQFADLVTRRMDRGKDMQKILRDKFGVGSIREGVRQGIFETPPPPLQDLPSLRGI